MNKKKPFMITIDTEGDNLWKQSPEMGDIITAENAKYIPRFQELCEAWGFYPTYLANYEMATSSCFVEYVKPKVQQNKCEIGMHLHAWNSPPLFPLETRKDGKAGNPYLIEYPTEIMEQKVQIMTELLSNTFEMSIVSHRAGRWAMNQEYFNTLDKYGYKVDCSVTPLMDWSGHPGQTAGSCGSDYSDYPHVPYVIQGTSMVELPLTVIRDHRRIVNNTRSITRYWKLYRRAKQGYGHLWLRPDGNNLTDLLYVAQKIRASSKHDYLMFMLHSSELMPGGSPTFDSEEKVEKLYADLHVLFGYLAENYQGCTVKDYVTNNDLIY